MTLVQVLGLGAAVAGFCMAWYLVAARAGVLWTRRALGAGAAVSGLGLLGLRFPWALDVMLAVDVALVALVWLDAALAVRLADVGKGTVRAGLRVVRDAPPAFSVGRGGDVSYRWMNSSARRARLLVREVRPNLLGGIQPRRSLIVPPHGEARETVTVRPLRRGRELGGGGPVGFAVDSAGPLGLGRRRGAIALPWDVAVYPPLVTVRLRASVARAQRRHEQGRAPLRRLGEGRLFESLREWVPGDDLRHIDWKATARRGKPMVAQYEVERAQQIVVAIDAGRLMAARLGDRRKLDYAVSAALAIAAIARLAADRVGVVAFAANILARVVPGTGTQHSAQLTDLLSDLEPRFEEADYERAFIEMERTLRRRSLVVLFTDLFDPIASSAVLGAAKLLTTRHLVLVVLMNDAAIAGALRRTPRDAQEAYRAAVAAKLAAERAHAVAALHERGVLVVDVPAAELTVALLDAYVDIKTRGLL